jgi:ParB family chromosome partitioning protein
MSKFKNSGLKNPLEILIPINDESNNNNKQNNKQIEIYIKDISLNPDQPRKTINKQELTRLTESIKQVGILQPLLVQKHNSGYQLINGQCRLEAAKAAKLDKVPVMILDKNVNGAERLELSLIENLFRSDLNPIDIAESFDKYLKEYKKQEKDIANFLQKSPSTISSLLKLLKLNESVKKDLKDYKLTVGHGKALSSLENNKELQEKARIEILSKSLSVRETENLVKKLIKNGKQKRKIDIEKQSYYESLSKAFSDSLGGLKVSFNYTGTNKKIEIFYKNNVDVELLMAKLGIKNI